MSKLSTHESDSLAFPAIRRALSTIKLSPVQLIAKRSLVYMERLTNPSAYSLPNPRTKQRI
jgi:hypothetical protein